ncbi:hypothetical protein V8V91_17140 [Algoriphagus halophilus]|uniref:hypothetical protein n=1 Tax=Algoriphagus halophilus TaxID=226505 RepID=UPI00358E8E2E
MKLTLKGIPINKVFYSGQEPKITNGCFQITNKEEQPIPLTILDVHISDGEKDVLINEFHLYKLPDYLEIDQKDLLVEKMDEFEFDLSFPFVSVIGFDREKVKVWVTIEAENEILKADSKVSFDLRVPK